LTEEHLLKGWEEFEAGALLFSFNGPADSRNFHVNNSFHHSVADWRVEKPVFNSEHCIDCQFCWVFCPDTSIIPKTVKETNKKGEEKEVVKFGHIDYVHCKGCGICSDVCPTNPKSLVMFADHLKDDECLRTWPKKEEKRDA
jgi:pyruvate ferredoxin oxidoreductase delta subunit